MTDRRCCRCTLILPVDAFYKFKDGYQSYCKQCLMAYLKTPAQRGRRRVWQRERSRHRYQNDPVFRAWKNARNREYQRRRYQADPEFRERCQAANRRYSERRKAKTNDDEHQ